MTGAVKRLCAGFARDIATAALEQTIKLELRIVLGMLYEVRSYLRPRRRRRIKPAARRRTARAPRAPRSFPVNPDRHRSFRVTLPAEPLEASPAAAPPRELLGLEPRPVVVRIDEKPPRIALLVGQTLSGLYGVRLYRGGSLSNWKAGTCFSPKVRRIVAGELVRDATPRELTLGFVVPDAVPAEASP